MLRRTSTLYPCGMRNLQFKGSTTLKFETSIRQSIKNAENQRLKQRWRNYISYWCGKLWGVVRNVLTAAVVWAFNCCSLRKKLSQSMQYSKHRRDCSLQWIGPYMSGYFYKGRLSKVSGTIRPLSWAHDLAVVISFSEMWSHRSTLNLQMLDGGRIS